MFSSKLTKKKQLKQKLKHQSPLNFLLCCQFDGTMGFPRLCLVP